jgi:translation initiation factor IF-2
MVRIEIDEKTRAKIVTLYRDQGVPIKLLQQRFHLGNRAVKRVLAAAGVSILSRDERGAVDLFRDPHG